MDDALDLSDDGGRWASADREVIPWLLTAGGLLSAAVLAVLG